MRVIGGTHGGRRLKSIATPGLRPTTDRVRESMFNVLSVRMDMVGATVLDLFAGTGALGIEALSRGALHCDFVERNGKAARILKENLVILDLNERGTVMVGDAMQCPERSEKQYDLILADPPYDAPLFQKLLVMVMSSSILKPEGLFVLEHSSFLQLPPVSFAEVLVEKSFGDTSVTLFGKGSTDEE